jgi:hypothetical protein
VLQSEVLQVQVQLLLWPDHQLLRPGADLLCSGSDLLRSRPDLLCPGCRLCGSVVRRPRRERW